MARRAAEAPPDPTFDPDIVPPDAPEDRRVVGDVTEDDAKESVPVVTELTAEERGDFASLLTVGRRTKKLTIMDHQVVVQTLKTSDEMRIGLYTKPYLESQGFSRAYQVAVCASGILEVDGKPLWRSLSESDNKDPDEVFRRSVNVVSEYYPIVISQVYQAIMDLEREFAELAIKLGKLPG